MIVTLTEEELERAVDEGDRRQANNESEGNPDRYGAKGGKRYHRLGAAGELAFCKGMDLVWTGPAGIRASDASGWEVRATFMTSNGCLIVHHGDHDDRRYALVHPLHEHERFTYRIVGWMLGADAKNDDWWKTKQKDGTPCLLYTSPSPRD